MNIDLKYSSQEIDEPLPFNILETPIKKKSNQIHKTDNFNSLLISLFKSFNFFYKTTIKACQEINNNNLAINNQMLFIKYLLSSIKNKISPNIEINKEIEQIKNYLIKMNFYKNSIDKKNLIIYKTCIAFHNNFLKNLKKLKNKSQSAQKSRNSFICENKNIKKILNNNYCNLLGFQKNSDYNSCMTSIDMGNDQIYSYRYDKNNKNIEYIPHNNSILNSFEKKNIKRFSYDNDNNLLHNQKIKKLANRINSTVINNKNRNIQLYNLEPKFINPYKNISEEIFFNQKIKNKKAKRSSSLSNMAPNISNIINNYYNDTGNNKNIINNKLELELAKKVISFFNIIKTIQKNDSINYDNIILNNQQLNKLKNYIINISKNILEKYNINYLDKDKSFRDINNGIDMDINKKYEKLLLEFKINMNKLHNIQKENNQIKSKYNKVNKSLQLCQQKYDDLLKTNLYNENIIKKKSPKNKVINRNNDINNELLLSKKLIDITKLSHQNSVYLLEMNKIQKEKDSILKKLEEKEKYIKSILNNYNKIKNENIKIKKNISSSYLNLIISKNSFYINKIKANNTNKNEINDLNNIIKQKEENIEKLKIEINQLNINNSKLKEEIKQKNYEIEKINKNIDELNEINNNNEVKIKEIIENKKNNEKINKEKIDNLINDNIKLKKENENYINTNINNINEINNQKNTISELEKQLNSNINNSIGYTNINNNKNNNNHSINSPKNDELYSFSIKDGKDIKTPSFLSPERNSKNNSIDDGLDINDLPHSANNNKNIINEYESKLKLLNESNNQLIKEINDMKNINNNKNKKIYKPEEYIIICDKNKDGLKWYLIKNKKYINIKNSYDNLFWVENNSILDIKKYNKFKSEEDEINEIIINNVKKLEEKEKIISKLSYRIENYENFEDSEEYEEEPQEIKKKIQKSKSEKNIKIVKNMGDIKNKINNSNIFNSKNKVNKNIEFEQNLNDNIRDDFSKNQYFFLEGKGLGLLNDDDKDIFNYK